MTDISMHDLLNPLSGGVASARAARCAAALALLALIAPTDLANAASPAPSPTPGPAFTAGAITVERPWSRATPGGATAATGYLVIRNAGDVPDRLVSASAEVAGRAGPHSMATVDGVMRMRPLAEGLVIPPHGTAVLAPGGDHLMFEDLRHPLRRGERFAATLAFERAGPLRVFFAVEAIGAKGPDAKSSDLGEPGGTAAPRMDMKMN